MSIYLHPLADISAERAQDNADAFLEALDDMPLETAVPLKMLIESIAEYLHKMGHPRMKSTARIHAAQAVAALVWDGRFDALIVEAVTAPTRAERL